MSAEEAIAEACRRMAAEAYRRADDDRAAAGMLSRFMATMAEADAVELEGLGDVYAWFYGRLAGLGPCMCRAPRPCLEVYGGRELARLPRVTYLPTEPVPGFEVLHSWPARPHILDYLPRGV